MWVEGTARVLEKCRICGGMILAEPMSEPTSITCNGCGRNYGFIAAEYGIHLRTAKEPEAPAAHETERTCQP